jgi:WD40 repeat protein
MGGSEAQRPEVADPYVGPRAIRPPWNLYGRDSEIRALDYLLTAERIVLLYAPSGAGKSSLVEAGLIPRLRERFDVWPPTRVHEEPEKGLRDTNRYTLSAVRGFEEGIPPERQRAAGIIAGQTLADYVRSRPRRPGAPESVVLIFDQFEEILFVDALAVEAKRAFFRQLGELLRDPLIWALFVLREDYLAPLDPYAAEVPTHLRNRLRIDLLDEKAALEAISEPARSAGRPFKDDGTVGALFRDLATVSVQRPDGLLGTETGRYVEPVQLQVVCRRLWAATAGKLFIEMTDLRSHGVVTDALSAYYDESVSGLARGEDTDLNRAIREWFDRLIRPGGVRGQVLRGSGSTEGLDNTLVQGLLNTHLVRAEPRAGKTWYELAHDRLIPPVQKSNQDWNRRHLREFQRQAQLWVSSGQKAGLLLRDSELHAALADAADWNVEHRLTPAEEAFLEACRQAQGDLDRERRRERRLRVYLRATIALALVAILGLIGMWHFLSETEKERNRARNEERNANEQRNRAVIAQHQAQEAQQEAARQAANANAERDKADREAASAQLARALALERESQAKRAFAAADAERKKARTAEAVATREAERATTAEATAQSNFTTAQVAQGKAQALQKLSEAQALAAEAQLLRRERDLAEATAKATAAYLLLLGDKDHRCDRDRGILTALHRQLERLTRRRLTVGGSCVGVLPVGRWVASAQPDQRVALYTKALFDRPTLGASMAVASTAQPATGACPLGETDLSLETCRFDWSVGRRVRVVALAGSSVAALSVATGDVGGSVAVWRPGDKRATWLPRPHECASTSDCVVTAIGFAPGEKCLATGGLNKKVLVDWPSRDITGATLTARGGVRSLAFDRGERGLCAGTDAGIECWAFDARAGGVPSVVAEWAGAPVFSVAFGPDSAGVPRLAFGTVDGEVGVISVPGMPFRHEAPMAEQATRSRLHASRVNAVAFNDSGDLIASAGADGRVIVWPWREGASEPLVFEGHEGQVRTVAFEEGGSELYSGGDDGTIRKWTPVMRQVATSVCRRVGDLKSSLEKDGDGRLQAALVETERNCAAILSQPSACGAE